MICYISGFDPITNNDFEIINKSLYSGEKIQICVDETIDYIESKGNRIEVLKELFENIDIVDKNDLQYSNYNKIYVNSNLKDLYKLNNLNSEKIKIIVVESNLNVNDFVLLINYDKIKKEIRDALNINLMYIESRLSNVMDEKRKLHSLNVGKTAIDIAKGLNLTDKKVLKKISFAGTVHDIAKQVNLEETKIIIESLDKTLSSEPWPVWHGFAGKYILKNKWLVDDNEILDSVFYHTVGRPNMSLIEKIVFCADKVSYERNYENVSNFREECINDLNRGFINLLKNQYEVAVKKHGINNVGKMLLNTMNYYLK